VRVIAEPIHKVPEEVAVTVGIGTTTKVLVAELVQVPLLPIMV
jgi:hypothetical protein